MDKGPRSGQCGMCLCNKRQWLQWAAENTRKLAEECENVGRQWGATGYFEQNGLFIDVKLWKNQPGRVKHKTVTHLMLRNPAEGPGVWRE